MPQPPAEVPETVFVEGSGQAFNTVPPSDFGFFELMNEVVQDEPAGSTNAELMGQLAAIGIVKGEPFEPDERMRRTLEDAAAVGAATSRALFFNSRASEEFALLRRLGVVQHAVGRRIHVRDAAAARHGRRDQAVHPRPASGSCTPGPRSCTPPPWSRPAMCMRLTGIGSQYLMAVKDADGNRLDGAKTYRVTLPPDIPAARFWSVTLYDNETRSMLETPQRFPRAGSQSYPTPAATANDDGSTTLTFGPERPSDCPEGNWIQTAEGKGWFPILRLYSPLAVVLRQVLAPERDRGRRLARPRRPPRPGNTSKERKHHVWIDRRNPCPRPARKHDRGVGRRIEPRSANAHARSHRRARRGRCPAGLVSAEPRSGRPTSGVDADEVRGVLTAIAPIVGTARVASATGTIVDALAVAIEIAELEEQDED